MLQLPCPNCGIRDEIEFYYGGESPVRRPMIDCTDVEWADYLFNRTNPKGEIRERWAHVFGCGRWFEVLRNTVTHEIIASYICSATHTQCSNPIYPSSRA